MQEEDLNSFIYKSSTFEKSTSLEPIEDKRYKSNLAKSMNEPPQIHLFNLNEEEDRDKEAVIACMRKYAKLWKNLFNRYANSGFSAK